MTEAALLAAVLDDYDDDLPRLALADWWEENGQDERAEFVRVQVALAALPAWVPGRPNEQGFISHGVPNARVAALRRRERALLETPHCPSCPGWLKRAIVGLPGKIPVSHHNPPHVTVGAGDSYEGPPKEYHLRRGFVAAVTCTAADWLEHGDAILAAQPVEEVKLTTWPKVLSVNDSTRRETRYCFQLDESGDDDKIIRCTHRYLNDARPTPASLTESLLRRRWDRVRHWHLPPDIRRMFQEAADRIRRDTEGVVAPHVPFVP